MTDRELHALDRLIRTYGYAGVVAALSAAAMREAHEMEQESMDPREYAELVGSLVWEAEVLGRCADELAAVEGSS